MVQERIRMTAKLQSLHSWWCLGLSKENHYFNFNRLANYMQSFVVIFKRTWATSKFQASHPFMRLETKQRKSSLEHQWKPNYMQSVIVPEKTHWNPNSTVYSHNEAWNLAKKLMVKLHWNPPSPGIPSHIRKDLNNLQMPRFTHLYESSDQEKEIDVWT